MKSKWIIYGVLGLLTALHLYQLSQRLAVNNMDMPADARNLYLLAQTSNNHENFYLDQHVKSTWSSIVNSENFKSTNPPGLPYSSMLYPPQSWTEFYFLKHISWKKFRWVNYIYNFLLLLVIGFMVHRLSKSNLATLSILLPLTAFKGTWQAYYVGQPMFLCIAFILFSYYFWRERKQQVLAGVFLGLAAFKFTLVIPFGLFFLYKKQWKLILSAASVVLLLLLPVVLQFPFGELMSTYSANVQAQILEIYSTGKNDLLYQTTELASLLYSGGILSGQAVSYFNLLLLSVGILFLFFNPLKIKEESQLLLFILWTYLFMYHLSYDSLLIIIFLIILRLRSMDDWIRYLPFLIVFFLPINGLLSRLGITFDLFYLHIPIAIFALCCYEMFGRKNRLKV